MAGLATIYRSKSLKTLVGNEEVKASLLQVLKRENPPSAFLFVGKPGTGKTTIGRIVKKALKCSDSDFKELNSSDDRGIDGIRKLIESMKFMPLSGKKKVILMDECAGLVKLAQNALLKALEEPPSHVHWILCTTNPEALLPALKRRCHTYELEPLKDADLHKLFRIILKKEKRESVSMEVRERILELADGSAGQALKLLDQVIDMDDKDAAIRTLQSAGTGESEVIEICRTLVNYNMPQKTKWAKIKTLLKNFKGDGESARRPILGYLNSIMLNNGGDDIFFQMQPFKNNFYDSGKAGLTMALYEAIFGGE